MRKREEDKREGRRKRDRGREKEKEQSLLFPFFSSLFVRCSFDRSFVRSFVHSLACSLLLSRSFTHSSSECVFLFLFLRDTRMLLFLSFFPSLLLFCHASRCICQCISGLLPQFFVLSAWYSLSLFLSLPLPAFASSFYSTLYIDRVDFHQFHRQYIRTECLFMKRQCHIVASNDFTLLLMPAVAQSLLQVLAKVKYC